MSKDKRLIVSEAAYILIENRLRAEQALSILRDILTGEEYGVSQAELIAITEPLYELTQRLYKQVGTQE